LNYLIKQEFALFLFLKIQLDLYIFLL